MAGLEQRQRRQFSLIQRDRDDTEDRDTPNLSRDESEDDHIIPSNQLAARDHSQRDEATTGNNNSQPPARGSQDEEDGLESWGILTQYIGPSTKPKNDGEDDNDHKHRAARKELDNFKR